MCYKCTGICVCDINAESDRIFVLHKYILQGNSHSGQRNGAKYTAYISQQILYIQHIVLMQMQVEWPYSMIVATEEVVNSPVVHGRSNMIIKQKINSPLHCMCLEYLLQKVTQTSRQSVYVMHIHEVLRM